MLLQIISDRKAEGIIKKYDYDYHAWWGRSTFENFEWIEQSLVDDFI